MVKSRDEFALWVAINLIAVLCLLNGEIELGTGVLTTGLIQFRTYLLIKRTESEED